MKRIITICAAILMTANVFAQAPNKMSYQAIIRYASNSLVVNQTVGMRISILQSSANGTPVYVETQTPITNSNGLASIEIGGGTVVSGNLSSISWANGPYFIKTETDPTGGTTYSIVGTNQLLSVPYALYAENAGNASASSFQGVKIGFNNSTTWICPTNVTQITVEVWGAGGGRGGYGISTNCIDTSFYSLYGYGGNGGNGGYNKQSITVTPGTSYVITVGNPGINGQDNYSSNSSCGISNGTAGEPSSFGGIVTANGGTGGTIGCSQCNSTVIPGTNGTDGVITNYTPASSLSRPYIPNGYLGLTPGCCAGSGVKGAVVISY